MAASGSVFFREGQLSKSLNFPVGRKWDGSKFIAINDTQTKMMPHHWLLGSARLGIECGPNTMMKGLGGNRDTGSFPRGDSESVQAKSAARIYVDTGMKLCSLHTYSSSHRVYSYIVDMKRHLNRCIRSYLGRI